MNDDPPPTRALSKAALPVVGEIMMDRYRVERMVGSGGMAHVLAARHVQLGTEVAIKVLDPTLVNDFDAKERFAREARAMASLSSKHTVRVFDVGFMASGLPFMVMELLVGQDLGQLLKRNGPLPIVEACEYIDQACEAVGEAHAAGIVHRDLKPQNLFLTFVKDRPMIRVLDFGIARSIGATKLDTITRMGDVVGTLHYMSPEQIRSSKEVDPRSDVWSLGACLYKLITGYPPFNQVGEAPLMSAILTIAPTPIGEYRKDVPAVVSSVVMRCLRKSKDERFPSVNELRKAIGEARSLMATDEFQAKTEVMRKGPPGTYKETLLSPTGPRLSPERAKLSATVPLDAAGGAEVRAAIAAAKAHARGGAEPPARSSSPSHPNLVTPRGSQPAIETMTSAPSSASPAPTQREPVRARGSALSFVMIIVAVAIGVFVAGLGLLFVLTRHH